MKQLEQAATQLPITHKAEAGGVFGSWCHHRLKSVRLSLNAGGTVLELSNQKASLEECSYGITAGAEEYIGTKGGGS